MSSGRPGEGRPLLESEHPNTQMMAACFHSMVQLILIRGSNTRLELAQRVISLSGEWLQPKWGVPALARAPQPAVPGAAAVAQLAWAPVLVSPSWYYRHRQALFATVRLGVWSLSAAWNDSGVQKTLRTAPMPGATGILRDVWRLLLGTRLLAIAFSCLTMPTSLALQLALQAHAVLMARRNTTICAAPLLSHPLTAWRLRWLNGALRSILVLGAPRAPQLERSPSLRAGRSTWHCHAPPGCLPSSAPSAARRSPPDARARCARACLRAQAAARSPRSRCWASPGAPRPRRTARPSLRSFMCSWRASPPLPSWCAPCVAPSRQPASTPAPY